MRTKDSIYRLQASWTVSTRNYLYRKAGLLRAARVVEIGCGTGVILNELCQRCEGKVFGVDADLSALRLARSQCNAALAGANGLVLPLKDESFDLVVSHYYLLWVDSMATALAEMKRVLKKKGFLVVMSEPDYDGIIEYPQIGVRERLVSILGEEGVKNFDAGRRLRSELYDLGFDPEVGVIPYQSEKENFDLLSTLGLTKSELKRLTTFFQPVFYAIARK